MSQVLERRLRYLHFLPASSGRWQSSQAVQVSIPWTSRDRSCACSITSPPSCGSRLPALGGSSVKCSFFTGRRQQSAARQATKVPADSTPVNIVVRKQSFKVVNKTKLTSVRMRTRKYFQKQQVTDGKVELKSAPQQQHEHRTGKKRTHGTFCIRTAVVLGA